MIGLDLLEVPYYSILGFYSNSTMSLFTTMIITNTVKIFQTRYRRLRKMIASDGSSD